MQSNVGYFRQVFLTIPGVAGGNTQVDFTFQDQPDIRYARMTGLVAYFANDMAVAFPAGPNVIGDNLANRVALVLQTNDPDDPVIPDPRRSGKKTKAKGIAGRFTGTLDTIQWIPLTQLHVNQSFGPGPAPASFVRQMIHWKDRYVIWDKSHVVIAPGGLGNTTDICICLGAFYSFLDEFGDPIYPRN